MILFALTTIIKAYPAIAIKLEVSGYILFAISLGWFFINDDLINMSANSDLLILNEKMYDLWHFNEDLYEYIESGNIDEIREKHHSMTKHIQQLEEGAEGLKRQERTSGIINGVLFALSSLLVAAGRGKDLILEIDKKKSKK